MNFQNKKLHLQKKNIMKISYFVILVLIFTQVNSLFAQEIEYSYDAAGNRTCRKIITLKSATTVNNQDSTNSDTTGNVNNSNVEPSKKKFLTDRLGKSVIKIYPNPTKRQITVVLAKNDICDNSSIELYSLSGKIIYRKNNISTINNIDLSDKPQGAYILRLILNNKKLEWEIIKE